MAPAVALPSQEARERTSPYQGLEPYSEEDAAYFFGRSAWREIIADHLCGYRVTVLYGASGVGKSSVLHAGVVDELRRQAIRNSEVSGRPELLPVILSRWSSDPLVSLTDAIQSGAAAIAPELADEPPVGSLADVLTAWSERVGGHVLVILDQFDEYFTYYERSAGGSAFADELVEAIENRDVPAHFLFSLREDALAKLDLFEDRITDLWQNLLRIEHLDREAAREAIERPVERWNEREAAQGQAIELEPGLVEAVLSEAKPASVRADKAGHGRLELAGDDAADEDLVEAPYLQLVMSRLWEEECGSGGRAIRIETLRRLGGGDRIFRRHFDSVMKSLPRRQRSVAARIFQYLVTPNGTKIALPPSALAKWAKQKESRVASVLKTLAGGERRILRTVSSAGDMEGETSYEIFHDRLAAGILDWRRRYGRRRTIRRILTFVVPPLGIALIAAIGVIGLQRSENADLSFEVSQLEARDQVEAAASISPYFGAMLPPHEDRVTSVAFSSDGRQIVTGSDDGTAIISRAQARGGFPRVNKDRVIDVGGPVARALFSPDNRLLGVETAEAWAGVWEADRKLFQIPASSEFTNIVFHNDRRVVLTALDNGTAHLWNARTGKSVAVFKAPEASLATASLSQDGRLLVTTGGKVARVWDVETRRPLVAPFRMSGEPVYAAFSPDGGSLVTVGIGDARLWSLRNRREVSLNGAGPVAAAFGEAGYSLAGIADFATDGRLALAGRRDVPVFDKQGRRLATLRGHTAATTVVKFSRGGQLVATAGLDRTARIWDARTGESLAVLEAHQGDVNALAFSPDGNLLVTASSDGTAILWRVQRLRRQVELDAAVRSSPYFSTMLPRHDDRVNSVAVSSDGGQGYRFVTASDDGTVVVSEAANVRAGELDVAREHVLEVELAHLALFSPDGDLLGVETGDAWAGVWGEDGKKRFEIPASSDFLSLAFTPDGTRVLTALDDGTAHLWDVRSGKSVAVFRGAEKPLTTASMNRDGRLLVSIGGKVARVWDVRRRLQVGAPFRLSSEPDYAALSPDGRSLLTVGPGDARLWDIGTRKAVALAGVSPESDLDFDYGLADFARDGRFALAGRPDVPVYDRSGRQLVVLQGLTTPTTVVRFSPDGRLVAAGGSGGKVRIWDARTGESRSPLTADLGPVSALAFSPDGNLIVTAGANGTPIVWRVPSR